MTSADDLHESAMVLADRGDELRKRGDHEGALRAFEGALCDERRAAESVMNEPSRGILYRSAAWLALEAMQPREAERLAALGLGSTDVSERVAEELRVVLEDARVRLHTALPPPSALSSVCVEIEGPEVGYGDADPAEVLPRVEALRTLVYRSAERRRRMPFRPSGQPTPDVRRSVQARLRLSPGSVVLRLVLGGNQATLWDENAALVQDILACFGAIGSEEALGRLIPDPTYRQNFVALAARLAPDGKRVSSVSLTGAASGSPCAAVALKLPDVAPARRPTGAPLLIFEGEIRAADETGTHNWIKLITSHDGVKKIRVSDALLEDIVRPFYGRSVRLQARPVARDFEMLGVPELLDD